MPDMENKETFASEMYADLKKRNDFNQKLIYVLLGIIVALFIALAGTNIYHIYQWSQFETITIDSGEGPANYVQGDNSGGNYYGSDSSAPQEEGQDQGR